MEKFEKKVLVYGTLRPELIVKRYGKEIADGFVFNGDPFNLQGYELYSYRDNYPIAVKLSDKDISDYISWGEPNRGIDVVKASIIDERIFNWVCNMEIGAGYKVIEIPVENVPHILFYQDKPNGSFYQDSIRRTYRSSWIQYLDDINLKKKPKPSKKSVGVTVGEPVPSLIRSMTIDEVRAVTNMTTWNSDEQEFRIVPTPQQEDIVQSISYEDYIRSIGIRNPNRPITDIFEQRRDVAYGIANFLVGEESELPSSISALRHYSSQLNEDVANSVERIVEESHLNESENEPFL